jgi:hypothetical protein
MKKYLAACGLSLFILLGLVDSSLAAEIDVYVPAEIEQDQIFPVQVYLNTEQQQTVGTDLLFSFDQAQLEFVKVEATEFYPHYHQVRIDQQKGQLRYSGTSNYQDYITGADVFANFFFVKRDQAQLSLDLVWEQDRTNDTNVVGVDGVDLVEQRPNLIAADAETFPDPSVFESLSETTLEPTDAQGEVLGEQQETITPRSKLEFKWWWLLILALFLLLVIIIKRIYDTKKHD